MDTDEMYRRGQADAAREDMNPFYYQHYYQYRRGYDQARRRSGLRGRVIPLAAGIVVVLVLGTVGVRALLKPPTAAVTAAAVVALPTATPAPLFPTPQAAQTVQALPTATAQLHIGGTAVVQNTAGRALRGRAAPKLAARVAVTFSEGEQVKLLEGPIDADGFRWWRIASAKGNGWSAERSASGETWMLPQP